MKKFRVKALSVGGRGAKKIYDAGDIVTQTNFVVPVDDLVAKGFLEELNENEGESVAPKVNDLIPPTDDIVPPTDGDIDPVVGEDLAGEIIEDKGPFVKPPFEEVTKKEIMAGLTERNIDFDQMKNKQELYDLWK